MKTALFFLGCCWLISTTAFAQSTASTSGTATAPTANVADYAGTYTFAAGSPLSTYTVTIKDGDVYGDAGMGNFNLVKQAKADQYQSTSSYGSIITFTRDASTKAVTGLTLAVQGQEISATKDK